MKNHTLVLLALTLGLVATLVAGLAAYLMPHIPLIWQVSLGVALAGFIAYLAMDWKSVGDIFSKKKTRYGLNAVAMSIIALGITVFLNLIANEHDWKKDFTKNQTHTLSEQSVKVVKSLTEPVTIKAFVDPRNKLDFQNIFERYTYHGDKLKFEFVDLDKDPRLVEQYKVKPGGSLIVESAARTARIDNLAGPDDPKIEEKITNAIIQVAKGDKKKIYFTSGHGERLPTDTGKEGYSTIKDTLEAGRYSVQELVTLQTEKMPADAEIVIVAGPKTDFMEGEIKLLEDYVHNGGKLLFMVEPESTPTIKPFLGRFGAEWNPKKTVYEANPLQKLLAGGNPLFPVVTAYDPTSEITKELRQLSFFPVPTPIEKSPTAPKELKIASLFSTSTRSLEVMLQGDRVKVDEKKDRKGPLSLALSIVGPANKAAAPAPKPEDKKEGEDKKDPEYRMVVVGDADFASNGPVNFGVNSDLFQNMLSWLAQEEDLISIRPKPTDQREFEITEMRAKLIHVASVYLLPALLLLSGFAVWMSRRNR